MRIKTEANEHLLECDSCGRIERLDMVHRDWVDVDFFVVGVQGGGPVEDEDGHKLYITACSKACLKREFPNFVEQYLHYMKARS
jgi:hypothetical protein